MKNKKIMHSKESKEKEEGLQSLPPTKAHPAMPPVKPPRQKSADADLQAKPASQEDTHIQTCRQSPGDRSIL